MKQVAKLQVRLPADLHQWFVEQACINDRSLNGQMITLLKEERERQSNNSKKP